MGNRFALLGLIVFGVLGSPVASQPGCPKGQTEIRPHRCETPKLDPPNIVDYRPRSTLVVAEHAVPRAKFPVIDFHGHPWQYLASSEALTRLGAALDSL